MIERARGTCIYCGAKDNLTADHIPPKALFSEPHHRISSLSPRVVRATSLTKRMMSIFVSRY
jgi:5-methylcytosine-specific restriction endonuclease McrA